MGQLRKGAQRSAVWAHGDEPLTQTSSSEVLEAFRGPGCRLIGSATIIQLRCCSKLTQTVVSYHSGACVPNGTDGNAQRTGVSHILAA